jgi:hypothetical protein
MEDMLASGPLISPFALQGLVIKWPLREWRSFRIVLGIEK